MGVSGLEKQKWESAPKKNPPPLHVDIAHTSISHIISFSSMSVTSTHHPFPHLIIFESSPWRQNTSFPFLHPAVCHQTFMSLSLLEDKCTIFQLIWKSFMLCRILLCILIFPNKPHFFYLYLLLQVLVYIF